MDPVRTADAGDGTASVSGVLAEYGQWLDRQRGLAPITIDNYCCNAEQFLAALPEPTQVSVSLLDAGAVTAFMVEYCRDRNTNSAKSMARSVRSLLRVGIWRRCRARRPQQMLSVSWRSRRGGGPLLRAAGTTRSCCCWPGSDFGGARSLLLAWMTSTGALGN